MVGNGGETIANYSSNISKLRFNFYQRYFKNTKQMDLNLCIRTSVNVIFIPVMKTTLVVFYIEDVAKILHSLIYRIAAN